MRFPSRQGVSNILIKMSDKTSYRIGTYKIIIDKVMSTYTASIYEGIRFIDGKSGFKNKSQAKSWVRKTLGLDN